jgi:N-acetyl-gamma-glutamyl-phosphate reductase
MTAHSLLAQSPVFVPSVARFRQGMIVQIGLHTNHLNGKPSADAVHAVLAEWYRGAEHVTVEAIHRDAKNLRLDPEELNGTNDLTIRVFATDGDQVLLAATFDNLGKGASGAAVQNLNIMLGLDRRLGLVAA